MRSSSQNHNRIYKICLAGVLAALSVVLVLFVHFPLIPAAPYLEYDAADIPVLLAGFILGPWYALGALFVESLVQAFLLGGNGIIGFLMHFAASGVMVVASSLIYRRRQTLPFAILGLSVGVVLMTAVMIPLNLIFTPLLFGTPADAVVEIIIPVLIPFNLIKSALNSAAAFVIYILLPQKLVIERP